MFYEAVKGAKLNIFEESGDCGVLSAGQYGAKTSYAQRGASPRDFLITECLESWTERKEGKLDEWYGSEGRSKLWSIK